MVVQDEEGGNVFLKVNSYMFEERDFRFFIYNYTGNLAEVVIDQVIWEPTIFILWRDEKNNNKINYVYPIAHRELQLNLANDDQSQTEGVL